MTCNRLQHGNMCERKTKKNLFKESVCLETPSFQSLFRYEKKFRMLFNALWTDGDALYNVGILDDLGQEGEIDTSCIYNFFLSRNSKLCFLLHLNKVGITKQL